MGSSGINADVNGKFISFATKVNDQAEKGGQAGKGKGAMGGKGKAWAPTPQASWTDAAMAQMAWSGAPGKGSKVPMGQSTGGLAGGASQMGPVSPEAVQQFVDAWGLNEDSIVKIDKLSPEALGRVIQQFKPRGESADWNGKFTTFASGVERGVKK